MTSPAMPCHPVPCAHAWVDTMLIGTAYAKAERCLDCGAVRFTTHAHLLLHLLPGAPRAVHYCPDPLCPGHPSVTTCVPANRPVQW